MNEGLTFVECLCLCNPCWCEDSDDYLFVGEEEGPFLYQEGELDQVSLKKKDKGEEGFILTKDYDPMKEYYNHFHTLGEKISNHVPSKVHFEGIVNDLKKAQGRGYLSLNTHLVHFNLYVCSLPVEHPERLVLIKEYERYMNIFLKVSINTDYFYAENYLKLARLEDARIVDQIIYYEKSIYYTHDTEEKNRLIDEFCQFCLEKSK